MKSLPSASLHDDSRRRVRPRCIDISDFEIHSLARVALKIPCRDGMGKRDPAIRAVLHRIEQGHLALVRRSDKHVGLVSSEEMYDKGNKRD